MISLTLRRTAPFMLVGLLAACGPQNAEDSLPQNEALENAPAGIVALDENTPLPPDFVIQALSTTEQAQMRDAVNAIRTKGTTCGTTSYPAAPALALQAGLQKASEGHAADMAAKNYFSHTSQDGRTPGMRITSAGYNWSTYGENIAAGYATIADVVKGWYASTGHCQNFMNKNFTQIGFGRGTNSASTYKTYWVADMGKPR